jgi:cytochrome c peroxidase
VTLTLFCAGLAFAQQPASLSDKESLGKQIYFDKNLSTPPGQSCATCHEPKAGFNGNGDAKVAVYEGAVKGAFGDRNPPAAAYASFSPTFGFNKERNEYVGGQFWDGRAATLKEQAKGPFLNPAEQNMANDKAVVEKVCNATYADLFKKVYGKEGCNDPGKAYDAIADAIAAYESSKEVNSFSSKYDMVLTGQTKLSDQEQRGLDLFNGKARCANCHSSAKGAKGEPPLFTDFRYENLGVPKNPANPHYTTTKQINPKGADFIDTGLGAVLEDPKQNGKFKVPTLRNVAVAPPYTHNGYFKTLDELVNFYSTRDVAGKWPPPEVPQNLNKADLGNLGLTAAEVQDIVAFLGTLTDGFKPPAK